MTDMLDPLARLKSFAALLDNMQVLREAHTFKLTGYIEDGLNYLAGVTPCEGTVTITFMYLAPTPTTKILSSEKPEVAIDAIFWRCGHVSHERKGRLELIRIEDDHDFVLLLVRYPDVVGSKVLALVTDIRTGA